MSLIVGSEALSRITKIGRTPADLDIIVPYDKVKDVVNHWSDYRGAKRQDEHIAIIETMAGRRIELLIATPGNAMWLYLEKYNAFEVAKYMDIQGLFSLKKSHIHIPVKFDKHINDYCLLNKLVGGIDTMPEITKQNNLDIKTRIGKKFHSPSLNKSVKDFFGQSEGMVKSWFVHDDIHRVMAYRKKPMYEYMQTDLSQAWCEKDMWEKFSYEDKMRCVLEEAYVIALERKIIPILYGGGSPYCSPSNALKWSMMRVCTTLTSGWFRKFATDNYINIMKYADIKYVSKFLKNVDKNKIKFTQPSVMCNN